MLAAWPWNQGKKHTEDETDIEDQPIHEGHIGDEQSEKPPQHKPEENVTPLPTSPPLHHKTTLKPLATTIKSELTPVHISPPQEVEDSDVHGETTRPRGDEDHDGHHGHPETTTVWNSVKVKNKTGVKTGDSRPAKGGRRIQSNEDTSAEWVSNAATESTGKNEKEKLQKLVDDDETTLAPTTPTTAPQPAEVAPYGDALETTVKSPEVTTTSPLASHHNDSDGSTLPPIGSPVVGDEGETETKEEVCETPTCKSISARMLALMDHSVKPCDDFYSFSCGGMIADGGHWITEDNAESRVQSRISDMLDLVHESSPISYKKFKSFYESCVQYDELASYGDRISKVHRILDSIGRFHSKSDWDENPGNLTSLLGILMKHHFAPLFDILLDVDSEDNSKFALKLTVPINKSPFGDGNGIALNGWPLESCKNSAIEKPEDGKTVDFNERYKIYADCNSDYRQYLKEAMYAINDTNMMKLVNDSATSLALSDVKINLDLTLSAKVYHNPSKKRTLKAKEFKLHTISDLMKKYPMIDWKILISMLIGDVPENTEVQVYFDSYFKSFFTKLSTSSIGQRELYNSLMAMFSHELYYGFVKSRSSCDRKNYCLAVAKDLMDPIASALFLQSYHSDELAEFQSKITMIFNDLVTSFKAEISTLPWMDAKSGYLALNKLTNLKLYADGGVSLFQNTTFLNAEFAKEAIGKLYLENAITLMKRYRERLYQVHKKNPSHPEQIWSHFLLPFEQAGIVIYGLNSIVIPYGMMSKPFFNKDFPASIQMSGLGFMIAHEIWHHFDTAGIRFGLVDQMETFSQDAIKVINRTVSCASDQYALPLHHTTADGITFKYKVNPSLSLNERLADAGGAHLGFKTIWGYSSSDGHKVLPWSNLTSIQLYFLSMAQNFCTKSSPFDEAVSIFEDVHLPPFWRVNDITHNSQEFAKAFSCPETPKPRCVPFTILIEHR